MRRVTIEVKQQIIVFVEDSQDTHLKRSDGKRQQSLYIQDWHPKYLLSGRTNLRTKTKLSAKTKLSISESIEDLVDCDHYLLRVLLSSVVYVNLLLVINKQKCQQLEVVLECRKSICIL